MQFVVPIYLLCASDWPPGFMQACQKSDWPIHKLECPAFVAHAERVSKDPGFEKVEGANCTHGGVPVPDETIRILARLLWLQTKQKPESGKASYFFSTIYFDVCLTLGA